MLRRLSPKMKNVAGPHVAWGSWSNPCGGRRRNASDGALPGVPQTPGSGASGVVGTRSIIVGSIPGSAPLFETALVMRPGVHGIANVVNLDGAAS